jgi:hypothetical protein
MLIRMELETILSPNDGLLLAWSSLNDIAVRRGFERGFFYRLVRPEKHRG